MVYSNKFVAVVVCNNHIVREIRENGNDNVRLPFGVDYSLKFKNQNGQRAVVEVEIDGQDVLDGDQLVVDGHSTSDLLGFMKGGTVYNAFRFIKKTQEVAEHRGDLIDDGFIRIAYRYEKPIIENYYSRPRPRLLKDIDHPHYGLGPIGSSTGGSPLRSNQGLERSFSHNDCGAQAMCDTDSQVTDSLSISDEGITVAGKDTHQDFRTIHVGSLETQEHVIVLHLLGQDKQGKRFVRPKLTRTRISCPTCGKRSRSDMCYCPGCGTNLTAVV